jgi:hypothetical protein
MGWIAIHRLRRGDPAHLNEPVWTTWRRAIQDAPEVCQFMRDADQVYVFPVILPVEHNQKRGMLIGSPHRDNTRMRQLDAEARRQLVPMLGSERDWFHGHDDTLWVGDIPTNVGFVFRRGADELVLYFTLGWKAECTMPNGENLAGSLEEKPSKKLDEWKKRYAQPELAAK